jgi:uncharacterized repeat protein (TIGR03803 family)
MSNAHFFSKSSRTCHLFPAVLGLFFATALSAYAQTLTTLYSFTGPPNDGANPSYYGALVFDSQGNLYGTTVSGGSFLSCSSGGYLDFCGTVFRLTPQGKETVLHNFGMLTSALQVDGADPLGGVVFGPQGNLYGTTEEGGTSWIPPFLGFGTVFELSPAGHDKILHSFVGRAKDGAYPYAGVVFDAQGNLYGTTNAGGSPSCDLGCGTVFKLAPDGTETVLHDFAGAPNDGAGPGAALVFGPQGNLYGTTRGGGSTAGYCLYVDLGCGTVFMITPDGQETILYDFSSLADGASPGGPLVFDSQGNLYGVTIDGGTGCDRGDGCGTVFKLAPDGTKTTLYNFTGGADGGGAYSGPGGGLIMDANGNLYGTTSGGGAYGGGVIFEITTTGTETVLYSFCSQSSCSDGAEPNGSLVFDAQGNLYGMTYTGGAVCDFPYQGSTCGTVFKLTP